MSTFDQFDPGAKPPSPAIPPSPPLPSIAKIAEALAKAQGEIVQPQKNKTVSVKDRDGKKLYDFEYADYNAIVEAVRGPLSKNGIAFTHLIEYVDRELVLLTQLIHSSGECLESIYPLPRGASPKDLGGAVTYGKRYCLSAITGCVADDDADAEPENVTSFKDTKPAGGKTKAAIKPKDGQPATSAVNSGASTLSGAPTSPTPNSAPPGASPEAPGGPSKDQIKRLFTVADQRGWSKEQVKIYMVTRFNVQSTHDLSLDQYNALVNQLERGTFAQARAMLITQGITSPDKMPEG